MKRRAVVIGVVAVVALGALGASFFTYRRYVVGRAPAEVCAETRYGKENVPDQALAILDSFTGIYELGGGCFAGWTPAVPSDEGAVHIWLVRDGVGHEYAWLTEHRHPRALDDAALVLHMAGYRALGR